MDRCCEPEFLGQVDGAGARQQVAEHAGDQPRREHAVGDRPLELRLLGESLVEMGGIGIARDGGVQLDVLRGDGPLEAGALADRDLVEGAVLDQAGPIHDVSLGIARSSKRRSTTESTTGMWQIGWDTVGEIVGLAESITYAGKPDRIVAPTRTEKGSWS